MSLPPTTGRTIAALAILLLLLGWYRLPPLALVLGLGGLGVYLLWRGLRRWTGHGGSHQRVTYWRGRRIELGPARRRDAETIVSLVAGTALLLIALLTLA